MAVTPLQKVLIVGPSWVGDMVMAQTLFITLRRLHPDVLIDVLAPAWSFPIIERMPEVRKAVVMPLGHGAVDLKTRYHLGVSLRDEGYDQAILLPNSLKSALVPWFANIPLRTGWKGEMRYGLLNDIRSLDKERYPLMIERFIALAYPPQAALPDPLPRPALQVDAASVAACLARFDLQAPSQEQTPDVRPVLALCPGAEFGPAKRWPEEHYAAVAAAKIAQGWQVWLLGSDNDAPVAAAILRLLDSEQQAHCSDLTGRTQLADAVDLLSVADAVVCNDSGSMHIAAALNRVLVVVYGSTSPGFTPPLNDRVAIKQLDLECSPCFERECPLGHLRCLRELEPDAVLAALDGLLQADGEPVVIEGGQP